VTYIVRRSFRAKCGEIKKGQVIAMAEDKAQPLLRAGKITELKGCHICHKYAWWLSMYGALRCGVCHPPVSGAVRRWIGGPEALGQAEGQRTRRHLLSWEERSEKQQGLEKFRANKMGKTKAEQGFMRVPEEENGVTPAIFKRNFQIKREAADGR
jgi:hypothetical protein